MINFGGIPNSRDFTIFFRSILRSQALETLCWIYCWPGPVPKIPKTSFSATFSGTRWTWLGFVPKPPKPDSSSEPYWTWLGSVPKPPGTFSGNFSGTLLNLSCLCIPKPPRPSPEPFPEPCWTWSDSTPYWIWLGSAPKPLKPSPGPSEPFPESRWTWPGACASPHQSNSGLKPPLAYAIGGKKLDDGWPESEKDVFQAALSMVVVKNSRWMVGEFYMSYGGVSCEK